jgi:Nif-specific regulatory protein
VSRLSLLIDLASLLAREIDLGKLFESACERVAEALSADRATLWLVDRERNELVTRVAHLPELAELRQPLDRGIAAHVARTGHTLRVANAALEPLFDPSADARTGYTTRSLLAAPIREHARAPVLGVVQVLNHRDGSFDTEDERYLEALGVQLAHAFALTTLRASEQREGLELRGPFNRIVGRSEAMREAYRRVALASETEASVLFTGETGTGKSLLARAIHVNSMRQSGPFVVLDCTTLPGQLVESELFGHERGAFTGADRRVPGKVELARGGTLFLDEVGDLPLEMQGKLLRFVQDRVFERVGGRETLASDARILCATHRDLKSLVRTGQFRGDLYYRIKVVEVEVPPLRDRGTEELWLLFEHFASLYAARHKRPRPTLSASLRSQLLRHQWPGNVRELEHWVESAVVLSPDGHVREDLAPSTIRRSGAPPSNGAPCFSAPLDLTLEQVERRYAEAVLAECEGNKTEAARKLDIGRNTLARLLSGGEKV